MSMNRIKDKINEIQNYLEEFENILPEDFEQYLENKEKRAACERYFEKIVESLVDLGHFVIKFKRFPSPSEDIKVFEILLEKKIIDKGLCERMKDAKGMRNILAHEYGKVNDEIVFEAITQEIIKDAEEFMKNVEEML